MRCSVAVLITLNQRLITTATQLATVILRLAVISSAQKRILAALVRARGDVALAAQEAGVTRQYVYEVMRRLKRLGVRFYAEPYYRALGLAPVMVLVGRCKPQAELVKHRVLYAKCYCFDGEDYELAVFVAPEERIDSVFMELVDKCLLVRELYDIIQPAPELDVRSFVCAALEKKLEAWQPKAFRRLEADAVDAVLLSKLGQDFYVTLKAVAKETGINRSTLSYHFRRHVKDLIRLRYYYTPLHGFPPTLIRVTLETKDAVSLLSRCDFVLRVLLSRDRREAYIITTLQADDFWRLLKYAPALSETIGNIKFVGLLDPQSMKFCVPNYSELLLRGET